MPNIIQVRRTILRAPAVIVTPPAGTPAYTYRNTLFSSDPGDTTDFTINMGTAAGLAIVGVSFQNSAGITSVIVDPTPGANITLTQDAFSTSGNSAAMYSGPIPSGLGSVIVRLMLVSGTFINRAIGVWTATGLSSNLRQASTTMSGTTASISITSGDLLFGALFSSFPSTNLSGTTPQSPIEHTSDVTNDFADWLTTSTASYSLLANNNTVGAFASYR